jgi:hypothetical protein
MTFRIYMTLTASLTLCSGFAAGCGSSSSTPPSAPNLGTPIFDSSVTTVVDYALSADSTTALAITSTVATGQQQIQSIDLATRTARVLSVLPDAFDRASLQRGGSSGAYYYLKSDDAGNAGDLIQIHPASGDFTETVVTTEAGDFYDDSYVVSPDGTYIAVSDGGYSSLIHPDGSAVGSQLPGLVAAFSPDSTQVVFRDNLQVFTIATGATQSWTPSHDIAASAANVLRWANDGLYALTGDGTKLYVDDILHQTSRYLWSQVTQAYYWADSSHLFEADGSCVDETGSGFCKAASFQLFYRGLDAATDSRQVANGDVSTSGAINVLPDGQHFIWLINGSLVIQTM